MKTDIYDKIISEIAKKANFKRSQFVNASSLKYFIHFKNLLTLVSYIPVILVLKIKFSKEQFEFENR